MVCGCFIHITLNLVWSSESCQADTKTIWSMSCRTCSNNTLKIWFCLLLSQSSITFVWWRNTTYEDNYCIFRFVWKTNKYLKLLISIDRRMFGGRRMATLLANKPVYYVFPKTQKHQDNKQNSSRKSFETKSSKLEMPFGPDWKWGISSILFE